MTLQRSIAGLATLALLVASAAAQAPTKKPSPWDPLRFFAGSWTGVGNGQLGTRFKRKT